MRRRRWRLWWRLIPVVIRWPNVPIDTIMNTGIAMTRNRGIISTHVRRSRKIDSNFHPRWRMRANSGTVLEIRVHHCRQGRGVRFATGRFLRALRLRCSTRNSRPLRLHPTLMPSPPTSPLLQKGDFKIMRSASPVRIRASTDLQLLRGYGCIDSRHQPPFPRIDTSLTCARR